MQYAHKELAVFNIKKTLILACAHQYFSWLFVCGFLLFQTELSEKSLSSAYLVSRQRSSYSHSSPAAWKRGLHQSKRSHISGVPTFPLPEIPEILEHWLGGLRAVVAQQDLLAWAASRGPESVTGLLPLLFRARRGVGQSADICIHASFLQDVLLY